MKNVTITVAEDVAQWARVEAARRGMSLARMVGELLRERMELARGYREAQQAFSSVVARPLRDRDHSLPKREELHDRPGLR